VKRIASRNRARRPWPGSPSVGSTFASAIPSAIFNVFFTLGVTSLILPVPLDLALNQVVIATVAVTALLVLWVTVLRRYMIGRSLGVVLLATYVGYLVVSLLA
jgi:cation:H+ antiporter